MLQLEVWLGRDLVGVLSHDGASNRFSFEYTEPWREQRRSFPIAPRLPLRRDTNQSDEAHSAEVRQFFENLLPEGEALDHAAQANGIAKSNLVGLVMALGKETSGAIRVAALRPDAADNQHDPGKEAPAMRLVTPQQLSERIRARTQMPFSVWDGKVRLSIAGYQDKIAVYERDNAWYLVDGPQLASTVIVKPAPVRAELASLPANEYMCMQLARRAGLEVATTRLVHVPEPVLLVSRFDRREEAGRVHRLHVIDGCQALGLSVSMKYERPYGDGPDVRNIRDGATYAKLFGLLEQSPQPARDKQALLHWVIFQTLIGNTDAHGKNISFFCGVDGLRVAPAYDLVCMPALGDPRLANTYALAVGDAFTEQELSPFEWASFAQHCSLPIRLVAQELRRLSVRVMDALQDVVDEVRADGVPPAIAQGIAEVVTRQCERWVQLGPAVAKVRASDVQ